MDIFGGIKGSLFIQFFGQMMWMNNYILGVKVDVYINIVGVVIMRYLQFDNFYFFIVNVFVGGIEIS